MLELAEDIESVFDQVVPILKEGGVFVSTIEALKDGINKKTEYFLGADVTVYRHSPEEIYELLANKGLRLLQEAAYEGYDRGDMNSAKVPYHISLIQSN